MVLSTKNVYEKSSTDFHSRDCDQLSKTNISDKAKNHVYLDFAVKTYNQSYAIDDNDIFTLRAHGFYDDDIAVGVTITAFFALSNRMAASLTSIAAKYEFYSLGREFQSPDSQSS